MTRVTSISTSLSMSQWLLPSTIILSAKAMTAVVGTCHGCDGCGFPWSIGNCHQDDTGMCPSILASPVGFALKSPSLAGLCVQPSG